MTNGFNIAPESVLGRNYEKIQKLTNYVKANMVNRQYHNFTHAIEATEAFAEIGKNENISAENMFIGNSAMIMHDLISIPYAKDNEEKTIEEARRILPIFGYNAHEISSISMIVYATKGGIEPASLLEEIAKDSDLDNLGRPNFFEKNEALRLELEHEKNLKWMQNSFNFLTNHRYYTSYANKMRNEGKKRNIILLNQMLASYIDIVPERLLK